MPTRMKDIAADLGVSVVTISKVLHNHRDISAATKERVLRRVRELNYRPSLRAQGLVSGKSFIIGVIVPDLVHAFFSEIAVSIASSVKAQGYNLLIASTNESAETEDAEMKSMLRHGVDALIVASCQPNSDFLLRVQEHDVPILMMDRHFSKIKTGFVGADDTLIGRMATEHLIDIGRRRIAHIGGGTVSTSLERLEGYRQALRKKKMRVLPEYVVKRDHIDESSDVTGREAMQSLLRLDRRPDAVFCHNDPTAIGVMNAILDHGLRIPEDIAVIGCGNIRYSESLRVPLSTIDVPAQSIGERAAEMILYQMSKGKEPKSILIPPRLIPRQSTMAGWRHKNS